MEEQELDKALVLLEERLQSDYSLSVIEYLQKRYHTNVTLVNSGSEALYRIFSHIKPKIKNKKILLPAYTCYAPIKAAITSGLKIVLVDVTDSFGIDIKLCKKIDDVGAIVVVHPYGIPLNMKPFQEFANEKSIILIEDFAQSFGAKIGKNEVGTFGDYSVMSFRIGKHLSGIVGGGILSKEKINISRKALDKKYLKLQIEIARNMVSKKRRNIESVSKKSIFSKELNSMQSLGKKVIKVWKLLIKSYMHKPNWEEGEMSNPQAYLIKTQLMKANEIISKRNEIAYQILKFYDQSNIMKPKVDSMSFPSFMAVPLLCNNRNKFEGILHMNKIHYEKKYNYSNIRLFPFLKRIGGKNSFLISKKIITFPTDPFYALSGNYELLENILKENQAELNHPFLI